MSADMFTSMIAGFLSQTASHYG